MSDSSVSAMLDGFDGLLSWPTLSEWIEAQPAVPGLGPVTSVDKMTAGLSNAVFLLHRGDTPIILRRPSLRAKPPKSNETMRREARILRALAGSHAPHPGPYLACDNESVTGACFYLMSPLEGMAKSGALEAPTRVRSNFQALAIWRIRLSDLEAKSYGFLELFVIALFGVAL